MNEKSNRYDFDNRKIKSARFHSTQNLIVVISISISLFNMLFSSVLYVPNILLYVREYDSGWAEKRFRYDVWRNEAFKFRYIEISDTIPNTTRTVCEGWKWRPNRSFYMLYSSSSFERTE